MYKTKLQEVCHKRQWALPNYTCTKCGPDHEARFRASVSVNGVSFDSLVDFSSLKQAHNHVARLAFLHFTSPHEPSGSDPSASLDHSSNDSSISIDKHEIEDLNLKIQSDSAALIHGIESQYKNQLLKYAKQRNLESPSYSSESEGSQASLFKATVRVSDRIFESPKSFKSSIEAENSAAKNALMSLIADNLNKDELRAYKSLLQELSHREGFCAPVYRTTNFGVPHKPMFSSAVELEGEIFHGKSANSKKLAELEAARVAFLALTERRERRIAEELSKYTLTTALDGDDYSLRSCVERESLENYGLGFSSAMKNDTSYLLCNKVRVYRKFPSRAFPEGIIVLPIGNDKWAAVSLEFPK